MITEIHLRNTGPGPRLDIEFAPRLNLITGDNGLGKTFLLDIAWWALTGTWAGPAALPSKPGGKNGAKYPGRTQDEIAEITCRLSGKEGADESFTSQYNFLSQSWPRPAERAALPGVVIYLRVDGGYSVWDAARNYWPNVAQGGANQPERPTAYHFSPSQVWDGISHGSEVVCNGLLRDWVSWQKEPGQPRTSQFNLLRRVLKLLSPPELSGGLQPGKPTRLPERGVLDIPTLELPYGSVAVTHASAGMKRILCLAYLLVWAWSEHVQTSNQQRQPPAEHLLLLIDEVEAHLHPKWQLAILPSVLDLANQLQARMPVQILACTHSPLVAASIEPWFDEAQDSLFSFETDGPRVWLEQKPWAKQGDVVNWLVSDAFDLEGGRSREATQSIAAADAWMRGESMDEYPEHLRSREDIHAALLRYLPGHDPYWPLWIVSRAEQGR